MKWIFLYKLKIWWWGACGRDGWCKTLVSWLGRYDYVLNNRYGMVWIFFFLLKFISYFGYEFVMGLHQLMILIGGWSHGMHSLSKPPPHEAWYLMANLTRQYVVEYYGIVMVISLRFSLGFLVYRIPTLVYMPCAFLLLPILRLKTNYWIWFYDSIVLGT